MATLARIRIPCEERWMTTYRRVAWERLTLTLGCTGVLATIFGVGFGWALGLETPARGWLGIVVYQLLVRGLVLRVELTDGALRVRRDGLWATRWDLREVERARIWTVRGRERGERWRLAGLGAVELTLRGGRTVRVGSDEPARMLEAIRAAAPGVAVDLDFAAGPARGLLNDPWFGYLVDVVEAAVIGSVLWVAASFAWHGLR